MTPKGVQKHSEKSDLKKINKRVKKPYGSDFQSLSVSFLGKEIQIFILKYNNLYQIQVWTSPIVIATYHID